MRDNRHINGALHDAAENRAIANARRQHPARKTNAEAELEGRSGIERLLAPRRD